MLLFSSNNSHLEEGLLVFYINPHTSLPLGGGGAGGGCYSITLTPPLSAELTLCA